MMTKENGRPDVNKRTKRHLHGSAECIIFAIEFSSNHNRTTIFKMSLEILDWLFTDRFYIFYLIIICRISSENWILTSYEKSTWKTRWSSFCTCLTYYKCLRQREIYFTHLCLFRRNEVLVDFPCWFFTTRHDSIFRRLSLASVKDWIIWSCSRHNLFNKK